jgi:hypothetical protein
MTLSFCTLSFFVSLRRAGGAAAKWRVAPYSSCRKYSIISLVGFSQQKKIKAKKHYTTIAALRQSQ